MNYLMDGILWVHIATGGAALVLGLFNLAFTGKGGQLHVRTGRLFWQSMIAMAVTAVLIAIERPRAGFVLIGVLSLYLVKTGRNALTRRPDAGNRDTVFWFVVATSCLVAGILAGSYAIATERQLFGSPAALYFGAAFDAAIFVMLDARLLRSGVPTGRHRIVDHLWRMVAALLFAMFALFLANPDVLPGWFSRAGLHYLAPLTIFVALVFWVVAVSRGAWPRAGAR
jgi:uncharacterized membrane protein